MDATKLLLIAGLALAAASTVMAAPLPPGQPNLAAQDDSGDSNSDNITAVQLPQFGGTCPDDGADITLQVDGGDVLPASTCSGGVYTVQMQAALTEGSHAITATATNSSGVSPRSLPTTVVIDVTPPSLQITSGPSGTVSDRTAVFEFSVGEGRPTQCALDSSAFSACVSPKNYSGLADGMHSFAVQASDIAGNMMSVGQSWTVGPQAAPGPPMLDASSDSGRSHADYVTSATSLLFIGVCVDGDKVRLYENGTLLGGPVTCNGGYAITVTTLGEGIHAVNATMERNGFESASGAAATLTIDRTAPAAPTITAPAAGDAPPNAVIRGRAEANAQVTVYEGQNIVCIANTKDPGDFSCNANFASGGEHQLTARATDLAGNTGALSNPPYVVTVDLLFRDGFDQAAR